MNLIEVGWILLFGYLCIDRGGPLPRRVNGHTWALFGLPPSVPGYVVQGTHSISPSTKESALAIVILTILAGMCIEFNKERRGDWAVGSGRDMCAEA